MNKLFVPGKLLTDQSIDECLNDHNGYLKVEFYNDWAKPQDFRHILGGPMRFGEKELFNFTLCRAKDHYQPSEIVRLKALFPHLRRAMDVELKLDGINFREAGIPERLNRLPIGVVYLSASLKITYANEAAWQLLLQEDGLSVRDDEFCAAGPYQPSLLKTLEASENFRQGYTLEWPEPLQIQRPSGEGALQLLAMPMHLEEPLPFLDSPATLVIIQDTDRKINNPDVSGYKVIPYTQGDLRGRAYMTAQRELLASRRDLDDDLRDHLAAITAGQVWGQWVGQGKILEDTEIGYKAVWNAKNRKIINSWHQAFDTFNRDIAGTYIPSARNQNASDSPVEAEVIVDDLLTTLPRDMASIRFNVFLMKEIQGIPPRIIAEFLGLDERNVHTLASRGKKELMHRIDSLS